MRALDGETGRDALRAVNNLAGTVAAQGDLAGAGELLRSVIAALAGVHGEQHPDCLTAMGNLAGILWQGGDHAEAYELQRQVVELHGRVHGADDRAARAAAAVLEMMERDSGF
jgi:hypothetical protein